MGLVSLEFDFLLRIHRGYTAGRYRGEKRRCS
jgi:hypothetical protein